MNYTWNHDYPQIARDSGFKLKQIREGRLDWRLLGTVDVDNLVRTQQLERLDSLVEHIAEAPLAKILDSNVLESGVAKYFQLAQLSIQYLVFCKRFLDETLTGVRSTLRDLRAENIELKELSKEHNDELLKLHKKLQKIEDINQIVFPCSMCPKNFISNDMLDTHIKKKHSKQCVGEKPSVENDTNLINTIKLELEIKHLKERLNVAEREIRDKQKHEPIILMEDKLVKVDNATEVSFKCYSVSTQTDNNVRNIGIQSNLEEPKEQDETDTSEKSSQQEILRDIHEKLLMLEEWKTKESSNNEQSIDLLRAKVNEIIFSVDEKLKLIQRFEIDKFDDKHTQADIEKIQKVLSDNLNKICNESECKLNNAIKAFEIGYKNKLEVMEDMIEKYERSLKAASVGNALKNMERNEITVRSIKPVSPIIQDKTKTLSSLKSRPAFISSSSKRTINESIESSSSESESINNKIITNKDYKEDTQSSISQKISEFRKSMPGLKPKNDMSKGKSPQERQPDHQPTIRQKAVKLFEKRLKLFGIDTETKTLSKNVQDEIVEKLIERRNAYRKKYPSYFATRNRLKQSVEKIAKDKIQTSQLEKKLVQTQVKEGSEQGFSIARKVKTSITEVSRQQSASETENSSSGNERKSPSLRLENVQYEDSLQKDADDFKSRLERILASPIKKPIVHTRSSTPKSNAFASTSSITGAHSDESLKRPIPTPRKKVMFAENSGHDIKDAILTPTAEDSDDSSGSSAEPDRTNISETSSVSSLLK